MLGSPRVAGRSIAMRLNGTFAGTFVSLALPLVACSTEKAPPPKTCCDQPKIPPGVTPFVVVGEDVSGPSDGEKVIMKVGLSQAAKREQIYPVLHTLYRHVMKRGAF